MYVTYKHLCIASKSIFAKQLDDKWFEEIGKNDRGNGAAEYVSLTKSQDNTYSIKSFSDDNTDSCNDVWDQKVTRQRRISAPTMFLSTFLPVLRCSGKDVELTSTSEILHATKLNRHKLSGPQMCCKILRLKQTKWKELELAPAWIHDKALSNEISSI